MSVAWGGQEGLGSSPTQPKFRTSRHTRVVPEKLIAELLISHWSLKSQIFFQVTECGILVVYIVFFFCSIVALGIVSFECWTSRVSDSARGFVDFWWACPFLTCIICTVRVRSFLALIVVYLHFYGTISYHLQSQSLATCIRNCITIHHGTTYCE